MYRKILHVSLLHTEMWIAYRNIYHTGNIWFCVFYWFCFLPSVWLWWERRCCVSVLCVRQTVHSAASLAVSWLFWCKEGETWSNTSSETWHSLMMCCSLFLQRSVSTDGRSALIILSAGFMTLWRVCGCSETQSSHRPRTPSYLTVSLVEMLVDVNTALRTIPTGSITEILSTWVSTGQW